MTGRVAAIVFFALAGLAPLLVRDAFLLDSLILILMWGTAAAAWNVAGGYAGQVSLGHSVFFGLGAYSAALLGTRWGLSPWIGLAVGAVVATTTGLAIGFLSNRLRGPYFVLATIACSQVLLVGASRWRGFTSGSEGIPVLGRRAHDLARVRPAHEREERGREDDRHRARDELREVEHGAREPHDHRVVVGAHEAGIRGPEHEGHVLERDGEPDGREHLHVVRRVDHGAHDDAIAHPADREEER